MKTYREDYSKPYTPVEPERPSHKRHRRTREDNYTRRENLRDEIEARKVVEQIRDILFKPWPESRLVHSELKAKLDGSFKLLAKVMPELKPIDVDLVREVAGGEAAVVNIMLPDGRKVGTVQPGTNGNEPMAIMPATEDCPWLQ
jgi:hypothetical protein